MKSHDRLRIVFAQIRQNWRLLLMLCMCMKTTA
nr:reverse transcriptase [Escherichia coli]